MIFVDTSAWLALTDINDEFHRRAISWFNSNKHKKFITSNLVIVESLGWVRYNRGKRIAVEMGKRLYSGKELYIERITQDLEKKAWLLFQKLDGRGISMIDCTSFVLMKRLKIKEVFAFDVDFEKQGFIVQPN